MLPARGPAEHPAGHSLSERPDTTRDHLPNPPGTRGGAPSGDCNAGRSEPPDGKSDCVGQGELREAATNRGPRKNRWHGRLHTAPPFPDADCHEPSSVSKATSVACSAGTHAHDSLDAASAAFEVGYESATQFNREYSRFFGQPPKRDIRTLRSPGAAPLESVSNQ